MARVSSTERLRAAGVADSMSGVFETIKKHVVSAELRPRDGQLRELAFTYSLDLHAAARKLIELDTEPSSDGPTSRPAATNGAAPCRKAAKSGDAAASSSGGGLLYPGLGSMKSLWPNAKIPASSSWSDKDGGDTAEAAPAAAPAFALPPRCATNPHTA